MKTSFSCFLFFVGISGFAGAVTASGAQPKDQRAKIGSVFYPPVDHGGRIYLVSSAGVLIESDLEQKAAKPLFQGKLQSSGALVLAGDRLYWGDGLHLSASSNLHVYDLKKKKVQSIAVAGHVERPVLVAEGRIFAPLGMGGIAAFDEKTLKPLWNTKVRGKTALHIDSNLLKVGSEICAASVYETKGVVCFELKTGKETRFGELKRNPKSEIVLHEGVIYGFATDADLMLSRFDIPSDLYGFEVSTGKMKFARELRGFNFFAPLPVKGALFVTLSTGDFLLLNPETQKITFLGEFSEPFINNPLLIDDEYCAIGIMGKFNCYTLAQGQPVLSKDRRVEGPAIGKISTLRSKFMIPTRTGYALY